MSTEGRDKPMTFPESEGEGTDGQGSPGIIEEKNRDAEAAQANKPAFDLDGDDTDGAGSTGMLDEQIREARPGEPERPASEWKATIATAPAAAASSTTGRRAIGNRPQEERTREPYRPQTERRSTAGGLGRYGNGCCRSAT